MIGLVIEKHLFFLRPNTNRPTWADDRNRTYVSNLEGWSNSHYTTSAYGAEDQVRTGHPNLGKVVLYRMSYFRKSGPDRIWTYDPLIMSQVLLTNWATSPFWKTDIGNFKCDDAHLIIVFQMWRITESNRWPSACKADALASWANSPIGISVPKAGIEPALPFSENEILSLARIPVSPSGLLFK